MTSYLEYELQEKGMIVQTVIKYHSFGEKDKVSTRDNLHVSVWGEGKGKGRRAQIRKSLTI